MNPLNIDEDGDFLEAQVLSAEDKTVLGFKCARNLKDLGMVLVSWYASATL